MVNVIFCGFGGAVDKRAVAKKGDQLLHVALDNGIMVPTGCKDGVCYA